MPVIQWLNGPWKKSTNDLFSVVNLQSRSYLPFRGNGPDEPGGPPKRLTLFAGRLLVVMSAQSKTNRASQAKLEHS
jgi:hypothetical protein